MCALISELPINIGTMATSVGSNFIYYLISIGISKTVIKYAFSGGLLPPHPLSPVYATEYHSIAYHGFDFNALLCFFSGCGSGWVLHGS